LLQEIAHEFNPFFIPKMIADVPGNISIKHGVYGSYTTVSACASAANAMIDTLNCIRLGYCDVVSGGSEAAVLAWVALVLCMRFQQKH
jgi:3-oxoacyl-[acyl-carrier-protein] synthase II